VFRAGPYPVQFIYKRYAPNIRGPPRPLCWWHAYICNRSQRRLCSQKAAKRPHFNGVVVWALEHKNQWTWDSGHVFFSLTWTGQGLSYSEKTVHTLCKSCKMSRVIFDKRITWRMLLETIAAEAFRTFIRVYPLFKSRRLSTNIKSTLHKALIRSVMTYTCSASELAADTYFMKLQRLQNKVLCIVFKFPRPTPTRQLRVAFKIPCVYDLIQNYSSSRQKSSKITKMQV
jgi:hypothetical protein